MTDVAREDIETVRKQFIAVTDPFDLWLCIDGNYMRPATKQETEMLALLDRIEQRLQELEA